MRAAAILGLGSSEKDLEPFRKIPGTDWRIGMPASGGEADAILIFGGDGTIHRHLGQLVRLGLPVLIVPRGSGNDFARALGLRTVRDSVAAWKKFVSGADMKTNLRTIDLGVITPLAPSGQDAPAKYFCCVGGFGLDGDVTSRANRMPRWLRGHGGYALSLPGALLRFAPFPLKVLLPREPNPEWQLRSYKPTMLAAFANAPAYGGGMRIAPRALLDDGLLDICLVTDLDRFKLFCLFPTVYFGRHLNVPEVEYFQARQVRVQPDTPLEVYADGEYVCQTPVEIGVQAGAMRVIVG